MLVAAKLMGVDFRCLAECASTHTPRVLGTHMTRDTALFPWALPGRGQKASVAPYHYSTIRIMR